MPSNVRFTSYDWKFLAESIGFELVRMQGENEALIRRPGNYETAYLVSENGGEVNLTKITYEPLPESVPYWDRTKVRGAAGPLTLATRIARAIDGDPPDYEWNGDVTADGKHIYIGGWAGEPA